MKNVAKTEKNPSEEIPLCTSHKRLKLRKNHVCRNFSSITVLKKSRSQSLSFEEHVKTKNHAGRAAGNS